MGSISHFTVMEQVKKNLVVELIDRAPEDPRRREDLLKFLSFESVPIVPEICNRLHELRLTAMVIGRMRYPAIKNENPKPKLTSICPKAIFTFFKQSVRFVFMHFFLKGLNRSLWMHDELQAMHIALMHKDKTASDIANSIGESY